jgi:hypothetical protein
MKEEKERKTEEEGEKMSEKLQTKYPHSRM